MSTDFFAQQNKPRIYAYTEPQYAKRPWTGVRNGKGVIKVGYTTKDVKERITEQYPVKRPGGHPFDILLDEVAIRNDGTLFKDHDVHNALKKMKVVRLDGEWFECTVDEIKAAVLAVRRRDTNPEAKLYTFKMRPEQQQAVAATEAYFRRYTPESVNKPPHFLWNAKMRFGKTFTSYQLAKKMGWKTILVLTFKPAVQNEWMKDLNGHVDFEGWQFVSKDTEMQFGDRDPAHPCVWFASFQDMLGRTDIGGIKPRNELAHATQWDCIILDEYHFGAWNESSKELYDAEDTKEKEFNDGGQSWFENEDELPLTANHYLYLSGTPFRAMATGEFLEDQIFNWTYSDEQRAKANWDPNKGANPYAELPQMVLMTYQMPREIREVALNTDTNEFDLNEFFKAEPVPDSLLEEYRFKHQDAVQKWLDLLRGQYLAQNIDELRSKVRPPMPFSDMRLRNSLSHTFWFLPSVNSCRAMAKLLAQQANSFYHEYKVIVCAGSKAGIGVKALGPVEDAIGNPLLTKTITLSCGKLTTGVTVPAWSGIFMLRNTSSPETYFQAAFRVQSPWYIRNPDGLSPNEQEIIKPVCYVFDYAPDRALSEIASYSTKLDFKSRERPEQLVEEFIRFLPVLCYDGSTMKQLNAGEILDLVISGTASTMLARRWQSALLVNVDNETLQRLMDNQQAMEAIQRIEGFRGINDDIAAIINRSEALKKLKKDKASNGNDNLTKKEKKELSDEEKDIKSKRRMIQEKLIKFATRIPIFMYLTDYREQTLQDIITQLETQLFTRVTGLTLTDFELLVSIGVFNGSVMNSAIFAFKRYEDASLSYTGIDKHKGEKVGGWDTVVTKEEADMLLDKNFKGKISRNKPPKNKK